MLVFLFEATYYVFQWNFFLNYLYLVKGGSISIGITISLLFCECIYFLAAFIVFLFKAKDFRLDSNFSWI